MSEHRRDGEYKPCPIVPDELITVNLGEMVLGYGGWIDCVHMFPDPRLNHVKYWDEDNSLQYHFFDQETLAALVEHGIPLAIRDRAFEREVESHKNHCWALAESMGMIASAGAAMLSEVMDDDTGAELTDAEIEWFWKEVE